MNLWLLPYVKVLSNKLKTQDFLFLLHNDSDKALKEAHLLPKLVLLLVYQCPLLNFIRWLLSFSSLRFLQQYLLVMARRRHSFQRVTAPKQKVGAATVTTSYLCPDCQSTKYHHPFCSPGVASVFVAFTKLTTTLGLTFESDQNNAVGKCGLFDEAAKHQSRISRAVE